MFSRSEHTNRREQTIKFTRGLQNTQGWGRTLEHLYIHIGTPAPASTAASLPTRRSCSLRNLPRRARAREHAHTPVLQPTCTPPRRTQQRVWARARAPPPLPPWASHAGGIVELTLKQICFRAKRGSAIRVQSFDDSLNSAIRTTYRISLRSSSLREPRYPLLEVVSVVRALLLRRARTRRCGSVRQVRTQKGGRPPGGQRPRT